MYNLQLINIKCVGFEDKHCSLFEKLSCQNQTRETTDQSLRQMISVHYPVALSPWVLQLESNTLYCGLKWTPPAYFLSTHFRDLTGISQIGVRSIEKFRRKLQQNCRDTAGNLPLLLNSTNSLAGMAKNERTGRAAHNLQSLRGKEMACAFNDVTK